MTTDQDRTKNFLWRCERHAVLKAIQRNEADLSKYKSREQRLPDDFDLDGCIERIQTVIEKLTSRRIFDLDLIEIKQHIDEVDQTFRLALDVITLTGTNRLTRSVLDIIDELKRSQRARAHIEYRIN